MKFVIVFVALFAVAFAAPVDDPKTATILRYDNDNDGLGTYNFAFETSDGQSRQEQGELKSIPNEEGTEEKAVVVQGRFSWVGDDGQTYTITYIADENGYQPTGDHLAKPVENTTV